MPAKRSASVAPKRVDKGESLEVVVKLLLALEDVLIGSTPNPEAVRELYAKLKEAS